VFPTARIWAPTQLSSPDFDLAFDTGEGKLFVLENKAPLTTDVVGWDYAIQINQRQLFNYLAHAELRERTFYVLPCPPFPASAVVRATPGQPPAPRPVLLPAGSGYRSTAGDWFLVIAAVDLWRSLWPNVPFPAIGGWWGPRTRPARLGGPRSRRIDPCGRIVRTQSGAWPLAGGQSLNEFLADVQSCAQLDSLYWRGGAASFDDEHAPSLPRELRYGPWSPTTLAVFIERDEQSRVFPNWPLSRPRTGDRY